MKPTRGNQFRQAAIRALADTNLQAALKGAWAGFVEKRREAIAVFPTFSATQDQAIQIRNHTLANLDHYLREFERNTVKAGGQVHWASTTEEANQIVANICKRVKARRITKGKSMVSEEMALNHALIQAGFQVRETDLGEYIIQLADETPSHIVAPAMHKTKAQVEALFDQFHQANLPHNRSREELVGEARSVLREDFIGADVGITGANFLIAGTGSTVLVTNEGNGDLTATLPDVHIITAGIEKVIPSREDLPAFLRLLARSATGQIITAYTTLFTGPKRSGDVDGPEEFHVILLDNGRSKMIGTSFQDALRCIRCGACMNHCAVYSKIGGHVYGSVYPGPIGQVMTPLLSGYEKGEEMIDACTLNGHCAAVCPMRIPLPSLIREHRIEALNHRPGHALQKTGLMLWAKLASWPGVYRPLSNFGVLLISLFPAGLVGWLDRLPGLSRWLQFRAMPRGGKRTFQSRFANRNPVGESAEK